MSHLGPYSVPAAREVSSGGGRRERIRTLPKVTCEDACTVFSASVIYENYVTRGRHTFQSLSFLRHWEKRRQADRSEWGTSVPRARATLSDWTKRGSTGGLAWEPL